MINPFSLEELVFGGPAFEETDLSRRVLCPPRKRVPLISHDGEHVILEIVGPRHGVHLSLTLTPAQAHALGATLRREAEALEEMTDEA